jgi:hypothetical protein
VLVVAVLCLFVLGVVPPLFSRSREHQERVSCGANLAEIGKTMLVYANDYDGAFPRSGGPTTTWGRTMDWAAPNRYVAFGISATDGNGGTATISSCFYLLVKYMEMPTRLFVCRGDKGTTEFDLALVFSGFQLTDAWDFGSASESFRHCSYAYHMPFGPYALTASRDPNLAVAADRNPWIMSPAAEPADFSLFMPDILPYSGSAETARAGNSVTHQNDGQNVLFLDGCVRFETRSYCGATNADAPAALSDMPDNIYALSSYISAGDPLGVVPSLSLLAVPNEYDSVLVHDPPPTGGTVKR